MFNNLRAIVSKDAGLPIVFGYPTGTHAIMPAPSVVFYYTFYDTTISNELFVISGSIGFGNYWTGSLNNGYALLNVDGNSYSNLVFRTPIIQLNNFNRFETIINSSGSLGMNRNSIGMSDGRDQGSNNAVYFNKDVSDNWHAQMIKSGSYNYDVDTGVPLEALLTKQTMSIVQFPANTCSFYINNSLVAKLSGSISDVPIYKIYQCSAAQNNAVESASIFSIYISSLE